MSFSFSIINSQLYPLEVVAACQVIQAGVSYQRAVVQFQNDQVLTGAGGQAQVPGNMQGLESPIVMPWPETPMTKP